MGDIDNEKEENIEGNYTFDENLNIPSSFNIMEISKGGEFNIEPTKKEIKQKETQNNQTQNTQNNINFNKNSDLHYKNIINDYSLITSRYNQTETELNKTTEKINKNNKKRLKINNIDKFPLRIF